MTQLFNTIKKLFYGSWLLVIIFLINLAILVLHLFKVPVIQVDNFTILLLLLMILIPLTTQIRKLRWGEFEAEIEGQIGKSAEREAEKLSKKITKSKDKKVLEQNKELIENKIDEFFRLGLQAGGYFKNRPYYQISNVRTYKDKDGKEILTWDEQ